MLTTRGGWQVKTAVSSAHDALVAACVAEAESMATAYRIPQPAICSRWPSKLHVFEMLLFAHSTVHPHEYIKKKKTRQKKKK
mmetsp:Transcript_4974/g.11395  ORF Transcript_4974/g.11395 Transcript_4974/m.11395 type:complete len:82 (-) Transcript_4974:138-383(-)